MGKVANNEATWGMWHPGRPLPSTVLRRKEFDR